MLCFKCISYTPLLYWKYHKYAYDVWSYILNKKIKTFKSHHPNRSGGGRLRLCVSHGNDVTSHVCEIVLFFSATGVSMVTRTTERLRWKPIMFFAPAEVYLNDRVRWRKTKKDIDEGEFISGGLSWRFSQARHEDVDVVVSRAASASWFF